MRNWITIVETATEWPPTIDGTDLANLVLRNDMHHSPEDFSDGDIYDNIAAYGTYHLQQIPLSDLSLDLYTIHDDLVDDYAARSTTAPPIIASPQWGIIIDGNHRANAAAKRGETHILGYMGDADTYSPPDEEHDDGEWHPKDDW